MNDSGSLVRLKSSDIGCSRLGVIFIAQFRTETDSCCTHYTVILLDLAFQLATKITQFCKWCSYLWFDVSTCGTVLWRHFTWYDVTTRDMTSPHVIWRHTTGARRTRQWSRRSGKRPPSQLTFTSATVDPVWTPTPTRFSYYLKQLVFFHRDLGNSSWSFLHLCIWVNFSSSA